MAKEKRFKDIDWNLPATSDGNIASWVALHAAILMDIRDELKKLNALFYCANFTEMPAVLRQVEKNTRKVTRPRKAPVKRATSQA